jgi:hypothetical protein
MFNSHISNENLIKLVDSALNSAMYEQQRQYLYMHRQRYTYTLQKLHAYLPAKSFS